MTAHAHALYIQTFIFIFIEKAQSIHVRREFNFFVSVKTQWWTGEQWSKVVFTDQSSFVIDIKDRRIRCYRIYGERYSDNNLIEIQNKGYGI